MFHLAQLQKSQTRGISRRRQSFFFFLLPSWGAKALSEKTNTQGFSVACRYKFRRRLKYSPDHCRQSDYLFPSHACTAEARGLVGLIKSLYSTKPRKNKIERVASVFNVCAILGFDHSTLTEVTKCTRQLSFFCLWCSLPLSCPLLSPSSPSPVILIHSLPSLETCASASFATLSPGQRGWVWHGMWSNLARLILSILFLTRVLNTSIKPPPQGRLCSMLGRLSPPVRVQCALWTGDITRRKIKKRREKRGGKKRGEERGRERRHGDCWDGKVFFFFFALSTVGDIRLSFSVRKNKHSSHQGHCTCRLDSFIYSDSNALNMPESTVNGKIYANLKKIYLFMPSACSELLQHHVRSGLTSHPACYCQHLSVSNYSIKSPACQRRTTPYDVDDSSGEGTALWMVCWTQCSIYSGLRFPSINGTMTESRREGEKRGARRESGARSEAFLSPSCSTSWTEYQLEGKKNKKKRLSVCVARALIRACECSTSFFLRRGLESYMCFPRPLPASHQRGGTVSPSRPRFPYRRPPAPLSSPALSGCTLQTYIIGHHCYAWGSTAFILISACRPICEKNGIIPPRQTNHLSNCTPDQSSALPEPPVVVHAKVKTKKNVWERHFLQPAKLTADVYHHKRWSYARIPRH